MEANLTMKKKKKKKIIALVAALCTPTCWNI